jgi:hypothetical protein
MAALIEVKSEKDFTKFEEITTASGPFSEVWLQEVLRQHPDILPVEEFGSVFSPLISIGREVPTAAGSIDNLFISHSGYLVIVETKLWRNPEAKREVVAQLIDYATSLARVSYDELDEMVRQYLRRYEQLDLSLEQWVEAQLEPVDFGFQRRVARNLKLGRFLLLIVTDHARPSVLDMLRRVNAYPSLSIDIAVVEMRPFRRLGAGDNGVLLIPYVAGRTEIIERSIVEVTVQGTTEAKVSVRQTRYEDDEVRRRRIDLKSEDAFWDLVKERTPESEEAARMLLDAFRDYEEISFSLRESSIVVEGSVPGTDVAVSLFFLKANGKVVFWPGTMRRRLKTAKIGEEIASEYIAGMRMLLDAGPDRSEFTRSVNEIDLETLRSLVRRFINRLEGAAEL